MYCLNVTINDVIYVFVNVIYTRRRNSSTMIRASMIRPDSPIQQVQQVIMVRLAEHGTDIKWYSWFSAVHSHEQIIEIGIIRFWNQDKASEGRRGEERTRVSTAAVNRPRSADECRRERKGEECVRQYVLVDDRPI